MIKVAGHWDIGYFAPLTESYYWSFPLRDFAVDEWLMCPISGIKNNEEKNIPLKEFPDYPSMLDYCDDLPRVFLEPRTSHQNPNTTWLRDFEHPQNCVYIFGSAHYNPTIGNYREGIDSVVTIETAKNNGILWSNQCVVVVLYDRMVKSWQ